MGKGSGVDGPTGLKVFGDLRIFCYYLERGVSRSGIKAIRSTFVCLTNPKSQSTRLDMYSQSGSRQSSPLSGFGIRVRKFDPN